MSSSAWRTVGIENKLEDAKQKSKYGRIDHITGEYWRADETFSHGRIDAHRRVDPLAPALY